MQDKNIVEAVVKWTCKCIFMFKPDWKNHYHQRCIYAIANSTYFSFSLSILPAACWMLREWYWWNLRLCRSVWGSLLHTYPQFLSYITGDSPGGTVLPITWCRWGTVTSDASMARMVHWASAVFVFNTSRLKL